MAKNTGLGRGLDALFSMPIADDEKQKAGDELKKLKLIDIEPNREQPRKTFDEDALSELAESIKRYGVIQPIVVTEKAGYYAIIAGERRWRAAKIAGLTEIPALIRDDDARKNKEISLIENMQREDLNAYEKAVGVKSLMEDYHLTQEEIAKVLGKGRSSIANTVRVLNLTPDVLELAKQGKTILINTLEIPEIQKVADYCAVFYNGEIIKILEHQEIDEMTVMMYSTNAAQAEEGK